MSDADARVCRHNEYSSTCAYCALAKLQQAHEQEPFLFERHMQAEVTAAHTGLDRYGVPRIQSALTLSVSQRFALLDEILHDSLSEARTHD